MSADTVTIGGDLTVRRLGYGGMALTGPGGWGELTDPGRGRAVLLRAVELGVQLIDTADSYGPEVSERTIAEALFPYPDELVICSKGGYVRTGPWAMHAEAGPAQLRAACEGSLRRLRLERIDLYQLHTIDRQVPFEESVGALAELRQEGKIRHVGLSNVSLEHVEAARRIVPIASVQNRYSLGNRKPAQEEILRYCEENRIAYLPWQPLSKGALTKRRGALRRVASRHGVTPAQVALAWLLARSPVLLPIPGTSSPAHLEENMGALALELGPEDVSSLEGFEPSQLTVRDVAKKLGLRPLVKAAMRFRR